MFDLKYLIKKSKILKILIPAILESLFISQSEVMCQHCTRSFMPDTDCLLHE